MNPVPGYAVYFSYTPPNGTPTLLVRIEYDLQPNKNYQFQLTGDGIDYHDVYSFTAVTGQKKFSHTVNPETGPWPRLLES